jgi:hypothetical protein
MVLIDPQDRAGEIVWPVDSQRSSRSTTDVKGVSEPSVDLARSPYSFYAVADVPDRPKCSLHALLIITRSVVSGSSIETAMISLTGQAGRPAGLSARSAGR